MTQFESPQPLREGNTAAGTMAPGSKTVMRPEARLAGAERSLHCAWPDATTDMRHALRNQEERTALWLQTRCLPS